MELSWPVAGGWGLAACMTITLVSWLILRRDRARAELKEQLREARKAAKDAEATYYDTARHGTPEEVVRAAMELDNARKRANDILVKLGNGLIVCLLAFSWSVAAGCMTTAEPAERIVRLDSHVRLVEPGENVPPYPDGENRWFLMTPTGIGWMVPKFDAGVGDE